MASRKLRLSGPADKFELAEVFSSGGQLCKERRLEDMDNPVGIQLLWPKVINAEVDRGMGLFTGYRSDIQAPTLPTPSNPSSYCFSFLCGLCLWDRRVGGLHVLMMGKLRLCLPVMLNPKKESAEGMTMP